MNRGDLGAAQTLADQAVKAADGAAGPNPAKLAGALDQRGDVEFKTGNFQKAMDDVQRVLSLAPGDVRAAAIYREAKAQLAAQAATAKAGGAAKKMADGVAGPELSPGGTRSTTNSDPRFQATAQNVAAVRRLKDAQRLLDMGDAQGALRAAAAAEAASPAFAADARVLQAQAWAVLKDLSKAVEHISEAIDLLARAGRKGDIAKAYSQRAAFQNDLDRPGDAVADSNRALENDAKLASAYYERSRGNDALGKADEAGADIDQAAQLDSSFMADRDQFHKRHRAAGAGSDAAAAADAPSAMSRMSDAVGGSGRLAAAALGAGFVLFAGYVLLFAKEGSPVHLTRFSRRNTTPASDAAGGIAAAAAAPAEGLEGRTIAGGKYRVVKKIGRGGMGTVYEAVDAELERSVAIKCINDDLNENEDLRRRFLEEGRLAAKLRHPNIVIVYDMIHEGGLTFIVFEYVAGRDVHSVIHERGERRALEPRTALEILTQVGQAIDYAHRSGVIHRDLKPSNVMIDEHGRAKVMDFGIARRLENQRTTLTNTTVGTPAYMAPEQRNGVATKQSDVFSLGVMAFELLTGRLPFEGGAEDKDRGRFLKPSALAKGSPLAAADAVFAKVLDPDHAKRYASCAQFCGALAAALRQATPSA